MTANNTILNKLYPLVEKNLKSTNYDKLTFQVIGKFRDKNMELLSTSGPCYRVTITDKDKDDFYSAIGLNEVLIKAALKESNYIQNSWAIMMNPFYTACATAIRYYIIKHKMDKANMISFYLCIGMYPLVHHKYFKYNCNENIMNYTISHLSHKYKYKQLKSLYATLQDLATVCTKTHESRLKVGADIDFTKYINDMHARLNDNLKNVAVEYYKNHESGNYLNVESDNMDEDDYREADNSSYAVERITNEIYENLETDESPQEKRGAEVKINYSNIRNNRNVGQYNRNIHEDTEKEAKRQRNIFLNDLIKILVLRELIGSDKIFKQKTSLL